jgi:cystathionine beta-lyase/cystathionine gamma-synthase
MDEKRSGPSTTAVHAGEPPHEVGGPVVSPIVLSTTYFGDPEGEAEVRYQRYFNGPNHVALSRRLAALEGAEDAMAFASGMSAMATALVSLLGAGDHVVATDAIYGGTRALLDNELSRLGISTTYVDFFTPGGSRPSARRPAWCWARPRPTRCSA